MKDEKSLQTSILNLTMHSQLIETNTNLQMDVLKQLDNNYENKTWQQETNDFQNKDYFNQIQTNNLFRNYFTIDQSSVSLNLYFY
jgi:hypothetical protein